jgi:branched-chain amino acid transport system ATP-binding protein
MPILEGEGVTKHFGGLAAVSRVDFNVDLISGALVPKPGAVRFMGENITGLKPHKICKMGVARTFQSVKVFANMPVLANVVLGTLFGTSNSMSSADAATEAMGLLEFVGLSAVRATPAKDLTLANQKRLEVARALATKPELLLLDELMAGLNPTEVAQAMELVTRIRDQGITIFMIEHVMKAIMSVCDRIMVLHHGKKIAEGTPQEIATSRTVVEVYLGE